MDNSLADRIEAKLRELGAEPNFHDALNCDIIIQNLTDMAKAGFNVDAFLAKQTEFYAMREEVEDLHRMFVATGGTCL